MMNHGVINQFYYKGKENNDKMLLRYPVLKQYQDYFNNYKSRDRYYVAMKYHAIKQIKLIAPDITWQYLGKIMNMHHSTVIYYATDKYTPLPDHDLFINDNFENYINGFIYPVSTREFSYSTQRELGEFKPQHFPLKTKHEQ